jgi:hypothetical protein
MLELTSADVRSMAITVDCRMCRHPHQRVLSPAKVAHVCEYIRIARLAYFAPWLHRYSCSQSARC